MSSCNLTEAYTRLSTRYRDKNSRPALKNSDEVQAYTEARAPATRAVLKTLIPLIRTQEITSILDIGSGTGASCDVFQPIFPESHWHFVEPNLSMKAVALQAIPPKTTIQWYSCLTQAPKAPLVILSYVLNEIPEKNVVTFLTESWNRTEDILILTLPGTPKDYALLMIARDFFKEKGAFLWGPCPHDRPCPLQGFSESKDWCHFSVRLERSRAHQQIKQGLKSYEDEKFCYLVVSRRQKPAADFATIIKVPRLRKGHAILDLCTPDGITVERISQKQKNIYHQARHSKWGDFWKADPHD